ncbi:hypothetical protein NL676_030660 [Syzygium grande]|nr:hypothetical protein NL676_030660 [Syzygium grande]
MMAACFGLHVHRTTQARTHASVHIRDELSHGQIDDRSFELVISPTTFQHSALDLALVGIDREDLRCLQKKTRSAPAHLPFGIERARAFGRHASMPPISSASVSSGDLTPTAFEFGVRGYYH